LIELERTFALSTEPPVNYSRPSIDVLFESAADVYRDRLVGVLLSGSTGDGALGLARIKAWGGLALCQDPATAEDATLPRAAIAATALDWIGSPRAIARKLSELSP
jgi:two-component system chemotaxis response regulator CheB